MSRHCVSCFGRHELGRGPSDSGGKHTGLVSQSEVAYLIGTVMPIHLPWGFELFSKQMQAASCKGSLSAAEKQSESSQIQGQGELSHAGMEQQQSECKFEKRLCFKGLFV